MRSALRSQRRDELALEQLGAAAIMREGGEHADHRQLAQSPVPLSVSMLQIAISSVAGTPNCRSRRESGAAWRYIRILARLIRGAAIASHARTTSNVL
jgi:hypothetical protein